MLLFLLHLLLLLLCVALSMAARRGMTDEGEGGCRGWPLEDLEGASGEPLGGVLWASWGFLGSLVPSAHPATVPELWV